MRNIGIPTDQSNEKNHSDADVLFATTTVGASDAVATLQFNHALHRININLKGTIPDDLTIEVKSLANGQISLKDGNATANLSADYVWIKPYRISNESYSLIILPQETQAFCSGEGLIRLTTEGKSASYTFNGNAEKFDAGMQTTLNLTLKTEDSNVDLEFSNQTYGCTELQLPTFRARKIFTLPDQGSKNSKTGYGSVMLMKRCIPRCCLRKNI